MNEVNDTPDHPAPDSGPERQQRRGWRRFLLATMLTAAVATAAVAALTGETATNQTDAATAACRVRAQRARRPVFVTRNGTWHQVVNIERRWRAIRKDTGFDWVTPHTFRKTVATLISEQVGSEEASRQLGHSSSQITREHYLARPSVAADHAELLQAFADGSTADQSPAHQTVEGPKPDETESVCDQ